MSEMSIEEAIRILDPETSADVIAEIEYYADFKKDKSIEKVNEACEIACDVMKRYLKLQKLIVSIQPKRKIQYYDSGKQYHTYMVGEIETHAVVVLIAIILNMMEKKFMEYVMLVTLTYMK